jgi:hypothetical protein
MSTHQEDSVEDLNQAIGNLADTWGEGNNVAFIREILRIAHFACKLQHESDSELHYYGVPTSSWPLVVPEPN